MDSVVILFGQLMFPRSGMNFQTQPYCQHGREVLKLLMKIKTLAHLLFYKRLPDMSKVTEQLLNGLIITAIIGREGVKVLEVLTFYVERLYRSLHVTNRLK